MRDARFIKSAVLAKDFPEPAEAELALVGRSNSGKSSLLNALTGKKGLARVSNTPGRTRLVNFFQVESSYRLVDLPGYGFAEGSSDEIRQWKSMVEGYLTKRESLVGLILVCDIRREWQDEEEMIKEWAQVQSIPFVLALNKSDKLSQNQITQQLKAWKRDSQLPEENLFVISALRSKGVDELEQWVFDSWVRKR